MTLWLIWRIEKGEFEEKGRGTVQLHWLLSSLRQKGGTKGDEMDSSKQAERM